MNIHNVLRLIYLAMYSIVICILHMTYIIYEVCPFSGFVADITSMIQWSLPSLEDSSGISKVINRSTQLRKYPVTIADHHGESLRF